MNSESAASPWRAITSSATYGKSASSSASARRSASVSAANSSIRASVAQRAASSRSCRSGASAALRRISTRCGNGISMPVPRERRRDVQAHLRIGPEVVREIGAPVAHRIVDRTVAEPGADDDQRRLRRHVADFRVREPVGNRGDHARRRRVIGHAELDVAPRRDPLVAAAPEHRHPVLDQLAVGNDDRLAHVGRDRRVAPADADHLAR